jgi:hypothetical protein
MLSGSEGARDWWSDSEGESKKAAGVMAGVGSWLTCAARERERRGRSSRGEPLPRRRGPAAERVTAGGGRLRRGCHG